MADPTMNNVAVSPGRTAGRRRSKRTRQTPRWRWVKKYRLELIAAGLFALGVFLLLERMKIKVVLWRGLVAAAQAVWHFLVTVWGYAYEAVEPVEVSDVVGGILIIAAVAIVAYRFRQRALVRYQPFDSLEGCPECGRELHRQKRSLKDRCLGYLLRVHIRQYVCRNCSYRRTSWRSLSGR